MKNLDFREIMKEDYEVLEDVILDTWNYHQFCKEDITAERLSKIFLLSCLIKQRFTYVALVNGVCAGVIMAKAKQDKNKLHPVWTLKLIYQYIRLMLTKDGRQTMKIFSNYDKINKDLYAISNTDYDGEVVFFVLNENARGKGIGKLLFMKAKEYLQSRNASNFYLYTDNSCNYKFYEHSGMKRKAERSFDMRPKFERDFSFYLYEDYLNNK